MTGAPRMALVATVVVTGKSNLVRSPDLHLQVFPASPASGHQCFSTAILTVDDALTARRVREPHTAQTCMNVTANSCQHSASPSHNLAFRTRTRMC